PAIVHKSRRDILQALTQLPNPRPLIVDHVLGQGPSGGDPDIASPWQDWQKIACIVSALEHVLDWCEMTACDTGRSLLCWLYSSRPEFCCQNPFTPLAEDSRRKRY
ncbi:hypothetical protein FOFC_17232, partial [Fusarium oxysporum]